MKCVDGWELRSLSALADYINGFAFKPDDWGNEGLPIIRIEQLKNPDAATDYFDGRLPPTFVIDDGDLIFSWSASLFLRIWTHGRAALNQHLFKVVEREHVDRLFLRAFIEFYLPELTKASHGSTMQHITRKELDRFAAPFPVWEAEQSKIAEVLSTVDRAIEQTDALIAKQHRIKTGLMQDLLTRGIDEHGNLRSEQTHEFKDSTLGRIPVEWDVAMLGEVIGPILSGWSPTCDPVPASIGEWAILKTTACVWSGYDETENKRLPAGLQEIPWIEVTVDDILITRKGPLERVGVVVHVHKTRPQLMIPDTVFKMRLTNDSQVIPAFLPLALGSATVQSDWFQKKIGLADAQVNLNHSILRSTRFPKPKPVEQERVLKVLNESNRCVYAGRESLEKLQSLKTALMQDLLTGNRRVTALLEPDGVRA